MAEIKGKNHGISLLKILSTTLILFMHYQQMTGLRFNNFINFYQGVGVVHNIVELFFIISGFLTFKYIKIIKNQQLSFKDFYIKKFLRFYPHITISIVVYLIIIYICKVVFGIFSNKPITIFNFIITSLGVQRWGLFQDPVYNNPMYYVSILMFCYIVFYFICYLSNRLSINENYMFLFVIMLGLYIFKQKINFLFINENLYRGYIAFFLGVILPNLNNKKKNNKFLIIAIFLTIYLYFNKNKNESYYLCTFVIYPLLVLYFVNFRFHFETVKNIIIILDKYSFYTYVWHSIYLIVYIYIFHLPSNWYMMLASAVLCWGIGAGYCHLVGEKINGIVNELKH